MYVCMYVCIASNCYKLTSDFLFISQIQFLSNKINSFFTFAFYKKAQSFFCFKSEFSVLNILNYIHTEVKL